MGFELSKVHGSLAKDELEQIEEIFFLCSDKKEFDSPQAKREFFDLWTGLYIGSPLAEVYLAKDQGKTIAYLMGSLDSSSALSFYENRLRSYKLFEDKFTDFPAHLHINCLPECQGRGVGRKLIESYVNDLERKQVCGVHLVTSPSASNVKFYKKQGFDICEEREWKGHGMLFMGRQI